MSVLLVTGPPGFYTEEIRAAGLVDWLAAWGRHLANGYRVCP
jgi:hypothetical protein